VLAAADDENQNRGACGAGQKRDQESHRSSVAQPALFLTIAVERYTDPLLAGRELRPPLGPAAPSNRLRG
jgi:hypothetical protein